MSFFFANLTGFSSFFSCSPKRTHVLEQVASKRIPTVSETRWNFKSRLVSTIADLREQLLEVFDIIIEGDDFENDDISIREANGLKRLLNDYTFNVILNIFKKKFTQTDLVFSIVQNQSTDIVYSKNRITKLVQNLKEFRENDSHFEFIRSDILNSLDITEPPKKRRQNRNEQDLIDTEKRTYFEILDTVITQIETRFKNFEDLKIFDLFLQTNFLYYSKDFPKYLLEKLFKNYPTFFNQAKLENELKVLYADPDIFGKWDKLKDMYNFINCNSLQKTIPEINKLLSLILSLPPTSASNERDFSCLKRVKTYCRNTMKQERMSSLSQMSIEKRLLKSLQKTDKFYEDVISHFATSKQRRLELIYKHV